MRVRMLRAQEDSVNEGRTSQRFESGQSYDVPDEPGQRWITEGRAVVLFSASAGLPAGGPAQADSA